jgi:hypothetical protein
MPLRHVSPSQDVTETGVSLRQVFRGERSGILIKGVVESGVLSSQQCHRVRAAV